MRIEILKDGAVENTILADEAFAQAVYPGRWRIAEEPEAPTPAAFPEVVITAILVDPDHMDRAQVAPDFSALKLPVGSTVTITAELQVGGARITGFSADFAMPMRSTEGAYRHLDVRFVDGVATFSAVMSDSKRWEVSKDLINSNLPAEAHMNFAGISITAVE